jgi:hypothetical protein
VFENRVLRLFGQKRDEVTGEYRKLHNEGIQDFYSSPSIMRIIKSSMNEEKRNAYRLLVGKPQEKRSLGRQRLRLVDNIRMQSWDGVM